MSDVTDASPKGSAKPSYPLPLRLFAMAIVLAMFAQAWRTIDAHPALMEDRGTVLLAIVCAAVVLSSLWHILIARTWIDATHVTQTGLWTRRLALADVRRINILYVPGLSWLISPRIRLQAASRGSYVFNTSDPRVLARFCELALGTVHDDADTRQV